MAKAPKTIYVCGECGYESGKWMGRCPNCDSWNTLVEAVPVPVVRTAAPARALPLSQVETTEARRISTGMAELDRVLGGGVVAGSTVLLGGDPGIGKSTLLMQTAARLTEIGTVLYVTGEEPQRSSSFGRRRLGVTGESFCLRRPTLQPLRRKSTAYIRHFSLLIPSRRWPAPKFRAHPVRSRRCARQPRF